MVKMDEYNRELRQKLGRLVDGERIDIDRVNELGCIRVVECGSLRVKYGVMRLPGGDQMVLRNGFTTYRLPFQSTKQYWSFFDVYPASTEVTSHFLENHIQAKHDQEMAANILAKIHSVPLGMIVDYAYSGEGDPFDVALATAGDALLIAGPYVRAGGGATKTVKAMVWGETALNATAGGKRLYDAYQLSEAGRELESNLASADAVLRLIGASFGARDLLQMRSIHYVMPSGVVADDVLTTPNPLLPIVNPDFFVPDISVLLVREAERRGLTTGRDSLVLWSGLGRDGITRSQQWTKVNGGMTLEMTTGGQWLNNMDLYGPSGMALGITLAQADATWATISEMAVNKASGQVRAILGNGYRVGKWQGNSVYGQVEKPTALTNPSVTGLDELYLSPKIRFR